MTNSQLTPAGSTISFHRNRAGSTSCFRERLWSDAQNWNILIILGEPKKQLTCSSSLGVAGSCSTIPANEQRERFLQLLCSVCKIYHKADLSWPYLFLIILPPTQRICTTFCFEPCSRCSVHTRLICWQFYSWVSDPLAHRNRKLIQS